MKTGVLRGDGCRGWATVLHLSPHGHDVPIVDHFARPTGDVINREFLSEFVRDLEPEVVAHFAEQRSR